MTGLPGEATREGDQGKLMSSHVVLRGVLQEEGFRSAYTNNCLYIKDQIFIVGEETSSYLRKWFLYPSCDKYKVIFNGGS